jgi:hypothetical protein
MFLNKPDLHPAVGTAVGEAGPQGDGHASEGRIASVGVVLAAGLLKEQTHDPIRHIREAAERHGSAYHHSGDFGRVSVKSAAVLGVVPFPKRGTIR